MDTRRAPRNSCLSGGLCFARKRYKDRREKLRQKKSNEMFNSVTEKQTPENQNQPHNSRREGVGPNTKRKPG